MTPRTPASRPATEAGDTRHDASQLVVGISDMKVSEGAEDVLVTYSLGSCLGVAVWDPVRRMGGLVHCLLPLAMANPEKARAKPAMFVNSGVSQLIRKLLEKGCKREFLVIKAVGGAAMMGADKAYQTGARNIAALTRLLEKNGLKLAAADLGGNMPRTMSLSIATGQVTVRSGCEGHAL